jgi:hypothetical protein
LPAALASTNGSKPSEVAEIMLCTTTPHLAMSRIIPRVCIADDITLGQKSRLTRCFFGQHYALFGMEQQPQFAATLPHFRNSR